MFYVVFDGKFKKICYKIHKYMTSKLLKCCDLYWARDYFHCKAAFCLLTNNSSKNVTSFNDK